MKISMASSMTWGLVCLFALIPCLGQEKPAARVADRAAPELGEYEMTWKSLASHSRVEFQIGGKGVSIKKSFKKGETPFFNAFEEGLKPGVYSFRIEFIPDEMAKDFENAQSGLKRMNDLVAARKEAYRKGDREKAKSLYKKLSQLREEVSEQGSRLQTKEYDTLVKSGKVKIDKDGVMKRYDAQKDAEQELKKYREELKRKPPVESDGGLNREY